MKQSFFYVVNRYVDHLPAIEPQGTSCWLHCWTVSNLLNAASRRSLYDAHRSNV